MLEKLTEMINDKLDNNSDTSNNTIDNSNNQIVTTFQLPIKYLEDKSPIQEHIASDLELVTTSNQSSLYNYVFNPSTDFANKIMPFWSEYYTTNTSFLKDSQYLFKNFEHIERTSPENITEIHDILEEVRNETGFYEKYKYIDVKYFEFLNNYPLFLQGLTLYHLTSPLISLLIPIIMLILPFFILKFQKISVSMSSYVSALLKVFKNHVIGKVITEFSSVGWDRRFFLLVSVGFYFLNIYQSISTCTTFYKNIYKIKSYLGTVNKFLVYSINSITNLNQHCKQSYEGFINKNEEVKEVLYTFSKEINLINLDAINIRQIGKIGNILNSFYKLFKNEIYKESINYALYLDGFVDNIMSLQSNLTIKIVNYCKFTTKPTSFKKAYFAPLVDKTPIKNTYKLDKNSIITGPNAAGKTTLLKTTLFNIILSQQLGIGFYKKANINPYKYIHSYINIPDTSGRDSLFQAEARRCREILDIIGCAKNDDRHFCIFDEIYSGTNPIEAIASAYSFLKYISRNRTVDFLLTTHYISLCQLLEKIPMMTNKHMLIHNDTNTYKLVTGISTVQGGIKVLEELGYCDEIIASAKDIVDTIII